MPALVDDIWFIHRELGFDMNQFNLMFAFGSELNRAAKGEAVLAPATPAQQQALYDALHDRLHRHRTRRRPAPQLV